MRTANPDGTANEVKELVEHYRRTARRVLMSGADAIEIHAHAGYLLDQFMTEAWNQRTNKYGGSFENRMRFLTEIYEAIRSQVGPDFPVLVRMGVTHDWKGGRTLEEGVKIVKYLEDLGVTALYIDVGCYDRKQWIMPSIYSGLSCMTDYAADVNDFLANHLTICYNLCQMVQSLSGGMKMTWTEYMRKVRRELEMSQEALAKELCVSYSSINRWERKQVVPSKLARKSFLDFCKSRNIPIPPEILEDGD
jgi:2,4-dienoyl-CoA reductase-like NADH-dependent reductase (Old Yellow Enzyme family)